MDNSGNQEVTSQLFLDDFPVNVAGECEFSRKFESGLSTNTTYILLQVRRQWKVSS